MDKQVDIFNRKTTGIEHRAAYLVLLAFGDRIDVSTENSVITRALDNFWVFIVTIIGFYFGGRSLERAAEKNRKGTGD